MYTQRVVFRSAWQSLGLILFSVLALFFTTDVTTVRAADPVDAGYRDFSYGTSCSSTPSGEKPESKLWFNDGLWWGSLCNGNDGKHHIYRLDLATQNWIDTNTILDDRPTSKADVLWDGQKLYVASALFTNSGAPASSQADWGRLYRFSYNAGNKTYSLDSGFPVTITRGKSETISFDKDSTGKLWVTYTESKKVMVNHSLSSDNNWGVPYALPVSGATGLTSDDISSLVSFSGRIGVMWSNQSTKIMYFASHADSDPNDQTWQVTNVYNPGGSAADDHINLKSLQGDDAGRVFAVAKTSFDSANMPQINLLVCKLDPCISTGNWQVYEVYRGQDGDTRPILLIDPGQRKLHVFTSLTGSGGEVHYKSSSMDNIQFPVGKGQVFIKNSADNQVNDASSTKQNVSSATGIVVIASSELTHYYYHNYMTLGGGGASPSISGFTPASGGVGTEVTVTGSNFSGATAVTFNGTAAAFTLDSATQIRAIVPAGATTGPLRVITPNGTGVSASNFTVPAANQAPSVNAGADQTIPNSSAATLDATVTDDGLPTPPTLTYLWEKVSGEGTVTFGNSTAQDTTATFSAAGVYGLRLTASDGALSGVDEVTVTVVDNGGVNTTEVRVAASSDDAEQQTSGSIARGSSALELVYNSGNQVVGLRFHSLNLPPGAIITNAYVQFYSTKNTSGATSLTLQGEKVNNALTFTSANNNISSRTRTSAAVNWSPAPWTQNLADLAQRTPNLATIIQEIVNLPGWANNNGLVLIITGSGQRIAGSFDRNAAQAPLLHIEYTTGSGVSPTISGFTPGSGEVGTVVTLSGSDFAGTTAVTFNGTAATFIVDSSTQIRATVPAGATSGLLGVTTTSGTATSANSFTVLATNQAPNVHAGVDQTITWPASATLDATVTDDGLPTPSTLTYLWEAVSGPGPVTFDNSTAQDTTASFSAAGVYVLRLTASDSALSGVDEVTITVQGSGGATTVEKRVAASSDDAEQQTSGAVKLSSSGLELVYDGGNQIVGLRFHSLNLPPGAIITNAYVQFYSPKSTSGATSLTIQGQSIDNAPTFTSTSNNISSRTRTSAAVNWSPAPWTQNIADVAQRTPNLAPILQEIVNRPGWANNNGLVLIITGSGQRIAGSYNRNAAQAPLLHVEYMSVSGAALQAEAVMPVTTAVEVENSIVNQEADEPVEVEEEAANYFIFLPTVAMQDSITTWGGDEVSNTDDAIVTDPAIDGTLEVEGEGANETAITEAEEVIDPGTAIVTEPGIDEVAEVEREDASESETTAVGEGVAADDAVVIDPESDETVEADTTGAVEPELVETIEAEEEVATYFIFLPTIAMQDDVTTLGSDETVNIDAAIVPDPDIDSAVEADGADTIEPDLIDPVEVEEPAASDASLLPSVANSESDERGAADDAIVTDPGVDATVEGDNADTVEPETLETVEGEAEEVSGNLIYLPTIAQTQ